MSNNSSIEWTDSTWNPVTGCTKYSPGCDNCYAERITKRQVGMGRQQYRNGFAVTCHPTALKTPATWMKPKMVFVCSMSDLFHKSVPDAFIHQVFQVMNRCPQHTFQVLTKRAKRLAELAPMLPWSRNIWAGVTIEADAYARRANLLKVVPATVKYLSLEPLLEPLPSLDLAGLD